MTILLHCWIWFSTLLAASTSGPSVDAPPMLPLPDLALAPVVTALDAEGSDGLVVRRLDNSYLTVRLAGVVVDPSDSARREMARKYLHSLLSGERVWIVHADASKPPATDRYYVYRWPDKLLVNLEMVRQGYCDTVPEKTAPTHVVKAFTYWRDQARLYQRGAWAVEERRETLATATRPIAAAPASAAASRPVEKLPSEVAADKIIVYVSPSGKKYHLAGCKALRGTKTPMTLEEARKHYEPCRQCNPPK